MFIDSAVPTIFCLNLCHFEIIYSAKVLCLQKRSTECLNLILTQIAWEHSVGDAKN